MRKASPLFILDWAGVFSEQVSLQVGSTCLLEIIFSLCLFLVGPTLLLEHYISSLLFSVGPTSLLGSSNFFRGFFDLFNGFSLTSWHLHL
jgi:hypothetical protein